jgi:hypothetical protein
VNSIAFPVRRQAIARPPGLLGAPNARSRPSRAASAASSCQRAADLVEDLQEIHDMNAVDEWNKQLASTARMHGLNYNPPTDSKLLTTIMI